MAGWLTPGLPTITATTVNAVASTPPVGSVTNLASATSLVPVDTVIAAGQPPQTVAASAFAIAACAIGLIRNPATSTAAAATLNTTSGQIVTEALTTAAGATYTFTLTNSLITTSTAAPQVAMHDGTNTAGNVAVTSITNGSGTCVIVFTNTGTAAWNGTKVIAFHT